MELVRVLKDRRRDNVNWIHLAEDGVQWRARELGCGPSNITNGKFLDQLSDS